MGKGRFSIAKKMKKIISLVKGKKTYIVGILMIVLGYLQNNNQMVLEGIGFITLRVGLSKTQ